MTVKDNYSIFLDTSSFIALLNIDDERHKVFKQALVQYTQENKKFITTHLILAELLNHFSRRKNLMLGIVPILEKFAKVHYFDQKIWNAAIERYNKYTDKDWGLVDCYSFEFMNSRNIKYALSTDKHFQQASMFRKLCQLMT